MKFDDFLLVVFGGGVKAELIQDGEYIIQHAGRKGCEKGSWQHKKTGDPGCSRRETLRSLAAHLPKGQWILKTISIRAADVSGFMKAMSKDVMDNYIKAGNKVMIATIGPTEGLLVPFD